MSLLNSRKILTIITFFIASPEVRAQWDFTNYNMEAGNYDNCPFDQEIFSVPGHITTTSDIVSTSIKLNLINSEIKAKDYIQLNPGINIKADCVNDNSNTLFEIKPLSNCNVVILNRNAGIVPKHEKIEFGIRPSDNLLSHISDFFNPSPAPFPINPYNSDSNDPDYISIVCQLTSPSNAHKLIYGFYYRPYITDSVNDRWHEIPTEYPFRVRFSPDEVGIWTIKVQINSNYGNEDYGISSTCTETFQNNPSQFYCSNNPNNLGTLIVGQYKHYLRFQDQAVSFFPVGENVSQIFGINPTPSTYWREQKIGLHELHAATGNTTRIFLSGWTFFPQSDNLIRFNQPGTGVFGNFDERQKHMGELDKMLELCHGYKMYTILSLLHYPDFHIGNDPWVAQWSDNPFNSINQNEIPNINQPRDFFESPACISKMKNIFRYILSRWGYDSNILSFEIFNEVDQMYDYNNDSQLQTDIYNFHDQMSTYIDQVDNGRHLITTSYAGSIKDASFTLPKIKYYSNHDYGQAFNQDRDTRQRKIQHFFFLDKPLILDEIGSRNPDHNEVISNSIIHNAAWSSMFTGAMGTSLTYFWDKIRIHNGQQDFRGMNQFISNVNFETDNFNPVVKYNNQLSQSAFFEGHLEFYALSNYSKTKIMGWVHNRTFYWGNENNGSGFDSCSQQCPNQQCDQSCAYHIWATYDPKEVPNNCPCPPFWTGDNQSIGGEQIEFGGLLVGKKYFIDWYNTTGSDLVYYTTTSKRGNLWGHLNVTVPWTWAGQSQFAFKIRRSTDQPWRLEQDTIEDQTEIDTICVHQQICITDTMYKSEITQRPFEYSYYWDFGNRISSNLPTPCFSYDSVGNYTINLYLSDSTGIVDSTAIPIFVKNCNQNRIIKSDIPKDVMINNSVTIYPNPSENEFLITNSSEENIREIFVFDIFGRTILESATEFNKINLESNESGIYYLFIKFKNSPSKIVKIIKL